MTDRELELQLRAWYRAEIPAAETAPAALRLSVTAIPRTSTPPVALFGRRRVALLAAAAAVSAALLGLLLLGSGNGPTQPPLPSATGVAPTAVDTRPAPIPARADQFEALVGLRAASDLIAWAETNDNIYRTEDTGATWRAVNPQSWTSEPPGVFVDSETAYLPAQADDAINVTHDGGVTWSSSVIAGAAGLGDPILSFRSASEVFVAYVDQDHFNQGDGTGLIVFRTTDGGASWQGPARGLQPHFDVSSNKVDTPVDGILVSSAGKSDTAPFENWFNLSTDGGQSWARHEFPGGRLAPTNAGKRVQDVLVEANGRLLIAVTADGGANALPQAVYDSGDDADSWRLVYEEPLVDADIQFLSETTWVLTSGSPTTVRTTTDGGTTWAVVFGPDELLNGAHFVQFATLRTGWAAVGCERLEGVSCGPSFDEQRALRLIVTTDGGATWMEVGP